MTSIFEDLFVLELANNHWGDLDRGLRIVDAFSEVVRRNDVHAAIKLQFRDVDSFVHPDHRHRDVRYIKKTLATRMEWTQLRTLLEAAREGGMTTMVTPFDEVSVQRCVDFGVDVLKIASSDIRDRSLLAAVAATGKPVIASSGGAELHHLDELVARFTATGVPFALNHCVSLYPSTDDQLQLNQIDFLRDRYPDITIGFSTHEQRDWQLSVAMAHAKGARTFERHIDIEHDGVPVSPYCTLPHQADTWFKAHKTAKAMSGGPSSVRRPVPEAERRYLDALVRGVYVRQDLPAGHVLTAEDVTLAIPLLKGQLSVREFTGSEALKRPVRAGSPIGFDQVDAPYTRDAQLAELVADRGLDAAQDPSPLASATGAPVNGGLPAPRAVGHLAAAAR